MSGTFSGQIAVAGERLDVDLEVSGETVRLATGAAEIGTWPIGQCRVTPRGDGTFELVVEGDTVGFTPGEPDAFAQVVEEIFSNGLTPLPGNSPIDFPPAAPVDEGPGPDQGEDVEEMEPEPGTEPEAEDSPEPEQPLPEGEEPAFPGFEPDQADENDDESEGFGFQLPAPRFEEVQEDARVPFAAETANEIEEDGEAQLPSVDASELRNKLVRRGLPAGLGKKLMLGAAGVGLVAVIVLTAPTAIATISEMLQGEETGTATEAPVTDAAPATTLPPTTVPTTTAVPPTTAADEENQTVSEPGVFSLPAAGFVAEWNATGSPIAQALRFESDQLIPGEFEETFTEFVWMEGRVGSDGALDQFSVVVDPSGPGAADRLGIQALGVAIAVTAPDLSGPERANLLARLGLDVSNPDLGGINGQAIVNGVDYRLSYSENLLVLGVAPSQ